MIKATNTQNGKAFEYALAQAFSKGTNAEIVASDAVRVAHTCYEGLAKDHQQLMTLASEEASLFLLAHDARIQLARSIIIQNDGLGIIGDVRDIIITVPGGGVGISAKHNHSAVKHSRLSNTIDFGKEWADYPCSSAYFKAIRPIFNELREMQTQEMFFRDIQSKESRIYLPVLIAFEDELKRLCESFHGLFVSRLFRYLLGRHDFYKVILTTAKRFRNVSVQSVNLEGTLAYGQKWKVPDRIIAVNRKRGSTNTIEVSFNDGWTISFRIHNASSRVEPSLKFDIQFVGMSSKVATHQISLV
jgi:hypothetical protein